MVQEIDKPVNGRKTGVIIQARMGSTRMPGKVALKLPFRSDKNVLDHIIARARACSEVDQVIIATSTLAADDGVAAIAQKNNIFCYRGSERDVLSRYYEAAKEAGIEVIARLTGDNPCIDPFYISEAVRIHKEKGADYTRTLGLPLGFDVEVAEFTAIEKAQRESNSEVEREHVMPFLYWHSEQFRIHIEKIEIEEWFAQIRLTLDYASDYALICLVYEKLYTENPLFGLKEIKQFFIEYPRLREVNATNVQTKV
jgi:spore coat polysaccharide biosynthesis protein SpsF